jgi:hypothetical protein
MLHYKEQTIDKGRQEKLMLINKASESILHKCFVAWATDLSELPEEKQSPLSKWLTSVYVEFCYKTYFRGRYRSG